MVAIAKNEAAYFIEWTAHHVALGFSSIHIYNNDSTDCSLELLGAVQGAIGNDSFEFHDFPRAHPLNQGRVPQLNAYNHALDRARTENVTHMMFLDLDELLVLKDNSIHETLEAHPTADSLSYHWMIYYGSPGAYEDRPMAERFCIPALNHSKNVELKSIARVGMIRDAGSHICKLLPGARALLSDGVTPNWEGQPGVQRLAEVNQNVKNRDGYFVAHYQSKSYQEYCVRRMKGCVLTPNGGRNVTHRPLPPPESNSDLNPPENAAREPIEEICPGVCARAGEHARGLRDSIDFDQRFAPRIKRFFAEQQTRYETEFAGPS